MSSSPRPHENTGIEKIEPVIPAPGSFEPRLVSVRLVCASDVMASALASLADLYGEAWQPSSQQAASSSDGILMQNGTLIVPVARKNPGA